VVAFGSPFSAGGKIDGSLKLLGYVEHLRGPETGSDLTTGGLMVGMAIHRR
jgi:hypothetical protein